LITLCLAGGLVPLRLSLATLGLTLLALALHSLVTLALLALPLHAPVMLALLAFALHALFTLALLALVWLALLCLPCCLIPIFLPPATLLGLTLLALVLRPAATILSSGTVLHLSAAAAGLFTARHFLGRRHGNARQQRSRAD
jgi:hypothetical protein